MFICLHLHVDLNLENRELKQIVILDVSSHGISRVTVWLQKLICHISCGKMPFKKYHISSNKCSRPLFNFEAYGTY